MLLIPTDYFSLYKNPSQMQMQLRFIVQSHLLEIAPMFQETNLTKLEVKIF